MLIFAIIVRCRIKTKMHKLFKILLFLAFLPCLLTPGLSRVLAEDIASSKILLNEVQTGSLSDAKEEFIEVYNPSDSDLDMNGWNLEYLSASGLTVTPLYSFSGDIPGKSIILLAHEGYYQAKADGFFGIGDSKSSGLLAQSGGHVRLKDSGGNIIDLIGWGSALNPETETVAAMPAGSSAERLIDCAGQPIDSNDNSSDFALNAMPTPGTLGNVITSGCDDDNQGSQNGGDSGNDGTGDDSGSSDNNDTGGQGAGPQTSCDGMIISELLPNPAGTDSGHEFIEIHNPTKDIIDMAGCKLQTSTSSKIYEFADLKLQPGQYKAFYNDKTGLTLANSGGGSVYLIDTDDTEIYQVDYEADLGDDVSWSLIGSHWTQSFSVTPDKANELLESKPCPAGQTRNGDTGRCINIIEEAAGLAPCSEGKERNPATNRCRNIASLATALKACAANQVRNPVTNRCRKIDGSTSALAPCKPGQERNPQTHRCRKAAATSSAGNLNDVKDVLSASSENTANWTVAALAVFGALSYAIFEWRNEIFQQLGIFKSKFS
jgi:hypothetical protein